jgi:TrkA-N domain
VSILLIAPGKNGADVIDHLIAQGDEVRVVEPDPQQAERWRSLGAYVARGDVDDGDLIERAGQNCRTLVLFEVRDEYVHVLEAALGGVAHTTIDRIVLVATGDEAKCLGLVRASQLDYVWLRVKQRSVLSRFRSSSPAIAEAVDAADDLAGDPHLELDLDEPATAAALRLGSG